MKKFGLIFLPLIFFACASQKSKAINFDGTPVVETSCPTEGTCTVTIVKDKSIVVKTDAINQIYTEFADSPGKVVLSYAYNKTKNPDYQDDFYSEEVQFETDENFSNLTTGEAPPMYFTVTCFCRGKAGTYRVDGGAITVEGKKLTITLPAIVNNQLTKNVTVLFK